MLLFIDIDGTYINYKAQTPDSAKKAALLAQENGHEIILCTGCSLFEIAQRDIGFKPDGIIAGNGCYVEYHNEVVKHQTLSLEQCNHFVNWCDKNDLTFRLECNSGIYCSQQFIDKSKVAFGIYENGAGQSQGNSDFVDEMTVVDNLIRDDVNKTAFLLNDLTDLDKAKAEFPDMVVSSWGGKDGIDLFGDTSPIGVSKQSAVELLCQYLNCSKENTVGFGDSKSDLPMFAAVGYKVAMGNGSDVIKQAADHVTDDVDDDGLYKAFKHLNLI